MKIKFIVIFMIIALVLSGCSFSEKAVWDRDPSEHWQISKTGEKTNVGEHEFDEEGFCTVCKSKIIIQINGNIDVCNYDENGNQIRLTSFPPGNYNPWEYITEYEYDENGEVSQSKTYCNGELCETFERNGETVQQDYYYDDGSHQLSIIYPGYLGNTIIKQWYSYDPDGNVSYESYTESLLDENGEAYLHKTSETIYSTETKIISESNAFMHPVSVEKYDFDGNLIDDYDYAYEYGEENLIIYEGIYRQGKIYKEHFSRVITEGEGLVNQPYKEVTHHENGYYIIEYDDMGNVSSETHYDPEGNVIE